MNNNIQELLAQTDIYLVDQLMKGRYKPDDFILDAGCGNGRNTYWFLQNGFHIKGIDNNVHRMMASLLYGAGMRLMECIRLRICDVDFDYKTIVIRDGKGKKDRIVPLPGRLRDALKRQIDDVKLQHEQDLQAGFGEVYLPFALDKKYPNAGHEWGWQYIFPSAKLSVDPHSGATGDPAHIGEPKVCAHINQQLLDARDIGNGVTHASCHDLSVAAGDSEDRISRQLPGPVKRDIAAAIGRNDINAVRHSQHVRHRSPYPKGVYRAMFEQ